MSRRTRMLLGAIALLSLILPLHGRTAHGAGTYDTPATVCPSGAYQTVRGTFTTLALCPTPVQSGSTVHFFVHSRRSLQVRLTVSYPTGELAVVSGMTDRDGNLALRPIVIRYNPVGQYAPVPFTLIVTARSNAAVSLDTISGTITVQQASVSVDARLRVRPSPVAEWCTARAQACRVTNHSTIVIRMDTAASVQVSITLTYPDGETLPGGSNEVTGSALTSDDGNGRGHYICRLAIEYQAQPTDLNTIITVSAQVGAGRPLTVPLMLVSA